MHWIVKFRRDTRGQDLIEYALLAGFIAVACGAVFPELTPSFSAIISRVGSALVMAGA